MSPLLQGYLSLVFKSLMKVLWNLYFDRNVQLGDCITPLPVTQDDDLPYQLDWRKRLETAPKRLLELPNGDKFMFDKDTRRWRRRIRYYKEVCVGCILLSQVAGRATSCPA